MRVGIIQTLGIGDIVIAAPIARHFIDQGHEVFWPIDLDLVEPFQYALPKINFLPVDKRIVGKNTADFFIETPKKLLADLQCDIVHILYSHLTGYDFGPLSKAISFDAYKYAICGVPFSEKWNFKINRNIERESKLFDELGLSIEEKYVVFHDQGSKFNYDFEGDCNELFGILKKVRISPLTDNFLDWIGVIEKSSGFFTVNSVYSNLVEQLGLDVIKYFKCQTAAQWTPVFKTKWNYL